MIAAASQGHPVTDRDMSSAVNAGYESTIASQRAFPPGLSHSAKQNTAQETDSEAPQWLEKKN